MVLINTINLYQYQRRQRWGCLCPYVLSALTRDGIWTADVGPGLHSAGHMPCTTPYRKMHVCNCKPVQWTLLGVVYSMHLSANSERLCSVLASGVWPPTCEGSSHFFHVECDCMCSTLAAAGVCGSGSGTVQGPAHAAGWHKGYRQSAYGTNILFLAHLLSWFAV